MVSMAPYSTEFNVLRLTPITRMTFPPSRPSLWSQTRPDRIEVTSAKQTARLRSHIPERKYNDNSRNLVMTKNKYSLRSEAAVSPKVGFGGARKESLGPAILISSRAWPGSSGRFVNI
jgi:hypothetical protein